MQKTKHLVTLNKTKFVVSLKKRFPSEFTDSHQTNIYFKRCDLVCFVEEVRKNDHTLRLT